MAAHQVAVIGRIDNRRIFPQMEVIKRRDNPAELVVEGRHHGVVLLEHVAHDRPEVILDVRLNLDLIGVILVEVSVRDDPLQQVEREAVFQ